MQIWKYKVGPGVWTEPMPSGAKPLSVQVQGQAPVMWVLVDPDAPVVNHGFEVVGTGHTLILNGTNFVDTFQLGELVFHLFYHGSEHTLAKGERARRQLMAESHPDDPDYQAGGKYDPDVGVY